MGQGNDRGSQYRSGLYYFDDEQKALIEASAAAYGSALEKAGKGQGPITTEIRAASDYPEIFYYAEVPLFSPCLSCVCVCGLLAQAQLCFCCCGGWLAGWLATCLPACAACCDHMVACVCRVPLAVCCVLCAGPSASQEYHQQYLAKPGARPYCSAQPQCVSLPPFAEWCPSPELLAPHSANMLPEQFWCVLRICPGGGSGGGGCCCCVAMGGAHAVSAPLATIL
jgi:hypothetical protein